MVLFVKNQCLKFVKTQPWVFPFCAQQSVLLVSWTRPACVAKVSSTSQANSVCLSMVKTNLTLAVPWSVINVMNKAKHVWQKYQLQANFVCLLLVKSKLALAVPWGNQRYFFAVNIDRANKFSLWMEIKYLPSYMRGKKGVSVQLWVEECFTVVSQLRYKNHIFLTVGCYCIK